MVCVPCVGACIAHLGAFGALSLVYPGGATLVYGGDGDPSYFSNDWVKFGAISNVALAVLAFFASKWDSNSTASAYVAAFVASFKLNSCVCMVLDVLQ